MTYSEKKERENRFKLALKIGFPFLFLIVIYFSLNSLYFIKDNEILLFGFLAIIYIYYTFYLIYRGFKSTIIDDITKSFNRTYILENLQKYIDKKLYCTVIMLKISNINDINDRYGVMYADKILNQFTNNLYEFLERKKYTKTPIGRYSGGYFLLLLKENENLATHLLNTFILNQKNKGINGVEIKIKLATTTIFYDNNKSNIISHLFDKLLYEQNLKLQKPDIYDKVVCQSIDNKEFSFSSQDILNLKNQKIKIKDILVKLQIKDFHMIPNSQIISIINKNGYEAKYDENVINAFLDEVDFSEDFIYCLHVSPVVLRTNKFKSFIIKKINAKQIDPSKIIFAFTELKVYDELKRFDEILKSFKKLGFKFLLKHFGGNNATSEYIKYLSIDYVSFDIEYSKYINQNTHKKIFQSYINLLKSLNIVSIVKFVQTKELYDIFVNFKVDMVQGHVISKPKNLKKSKNDNTIIS